MAAQELGATGKDTRQRHPQNLSEVVIVRTAARFAYLVLTQVQRGFAYVLNSPDPMFIGHIEPMLHVPKVVTDSEHVNVAVKVHAVILLSCGFLGPKIGGVVWAVFFR